MLHAGQRRRHGWRHCHRGRRAWWRRRRRRTSHGCWNRSRGRRYGEHRRMTCRDRRAWEGHNLIVVKSCTGGFSSAGPRGGCMNGIRGTTHTLTLQRTPDDCSLSTLRANLPPHVAPFSSARATLSQWCRSVKLVHK